MVGQVTLRAQFKREGPKYFYYLQLVTCALKLNETIDFETSYTFFQVECEDSPFFGRFDLPINLLLCWSDSHALFPVSMIRFVRSSDYECVI